MITKEVTKELHACDICKRHIPSTSYKQCIVCGREICGYCSVKLIRSFRKDPTTGYSLTTESLGRICKYCMKKLGVEIK